jgi:hypothetical protein
VDRGNGGWTGGRSCGDPGGVIVGLPEPGRSFS